MQRAWTGAAVFCAMAALFVTRAAGIDVGRLTPEPASVTYTDRTGAVLGTLLGADALQAGVPLRSVSPFFLQAIVAAEDGRFWGHGAVDVFALARAARDFAIYGQPRSGGSTIAMQLARLLGATEGGIGGKMRQIVLAERIAIASSKPAVLEAYVNRVPMGGNVAGVEAAARTYFGEPASDLDLAQAALLAAIPNDPPRLAPGGDWDALRARQHFVLDRMVALRTVSPAAAASAWRETLSIRRHDAGIGDAAQALFFLQRMRPQRGRVRTTIDRALQRFVQAQAQAVIAALQRYHVTDAAALVVDNRSGDVLAYAGSPDYFSDAALGRNDGVQALRQPGSSLKPFAYELALERGTIASTSILADVASTYSLPGGKLYQPEDYSGRFSGSVRVRYALANSLNAPAVQVLSKLGVGPFLARLRGLGFTHLERTPAYYGLGLTLGSAEVSLWELVQAYETLARSGARLSIHLRAGETPSRQMLGDAGDWQLVADILADPHARAKSFGVGSVLQMPFPAAVKTGTSSDFRDTWTVGFTRDYTVGVWVGNFDGSAMRGVSGVTGAGPLWNRIMLHLYERGEDPPPFPAPAGFVRTGICATTGHAAAPRDRCPALVQEWVRPADLAAVLRPAAAALAPGGGTVVRIVFPRDGDVFVANATVDELQRHEQQIALRAIGAGVHWNVDGVTVSRDSSGNAFWPLRLGTWHIVASDGVRHDRVTIRVVPPPRILHPGFTAVQ